MHTCTHTYTPVENNKIGSATEEEEKEDLNKNNDKRNDTEF